MNAIALQNLVSFIVDHAQAWKTFLENFADAAFLDFFYTQDGGCWNITTAAGEVVKFRMWESKVIGIFSASFTCVFVDGAEVKIC